MQKKKTLHEEIEDFQKEKSKLIPLLIFFGLLGLLFPILPGLALLFLGFLLIFPRQGEEVINKVRRFLNI
jgi:hypothetical protein